MRAVRFRQLLRGLSPSYFALVMATGILSIGTEQVGYPRLSQGLLWVALAAYVGLLILYLVRAVTFWSDTLLDLRDPERGFGYFTIVAGTDVLAVRLIDAGHVPAATGLAVVSATLWCVFGYVLPWMILMRPRPTPMLQGVNGTWFVWAVASQSLAIVAARLHPHVAGAELALGMVSVLLWTVGLMLYAGVAVLIVLRILQHGIRPLDFDPPFWISMGALAIAVVAGSSTVSIEHNPVVDAASPLIGGTIVVLWSFCMWLVPLLLGAGVWRHAIHRVPLGYTPGLWSMVFPVGMIGVASLQLEPLTGLPVFTTIGVVFVGLGLGAWVLTVLALILRRRS